MRLTHQYTATETLQNGATGNVNGTVGQPDGMNGGTYVWITNGAGTCTVTIQGSLDKAFAVAQDTLTLGVVKLSDSGAGTNTTRSVISGAIAVAANTSYLFYVPDPTPYMRAPISGAAGLAAGTAHTGCTVSLYEMVS